MEREDLIKNEIYHLSRPVWNYGYIFKHIGIGFYRDEVGSKRYEANIYNDRYADEIIRLATSQEKAHLQACIDAGEYVEYKEFVLPTDWCVKSTKKTHIILRNWAEFDWWNNYTEDLIIYSTKTWNSTHGTSHNNSIEITFDQFKQYVLNFNVDKPKANSFVKGDYIVFTSGYMPDNYSFPINYVFKQKKDSDYLQVYEDAKGVENGWDNPRKFNCSYVDAEFKSTWRYATPEEIAEYDRIGPFDVNTLNKPKFEAGDWVSYTHNSGKLVYTDKIKEWGSASYCKLERGKEPFKTLLRHATKQEIDDQLYNLKQAEHFEPIVNMNSLLEEAKRRYPVGTKFKSCWKNSIGERAICIINGLFLKDCKENIGNVIQNEDCGWVWWNNQWAEIISLPETKQLQQPTTALNIWLEETKAKNLSLEKLANLINNANNLSIYDGLDGEKSWDKAKILYDKWNGDKIPEESICTFDGSDKWNWVRTGLVKIEEVGKYPEISFKPKESNVIDKNKYFKEEQIESLESLISNL